jgi:hypothetical protein
MNGHIDADGLAEFRVGLITGRRQREIAAHLATCAQCASLADRLAEVSMLLAAVPAPAMPDAVSARLQAAFDAESAISTEQTVVKPAKPRFRLPRLLPIRVLAPVAAVAVLAVGAFGLSRLSSSPSYSQPASGSAAEVPAAPARPSQMEGGFATGHADEGQAIGVEGPLMVVPSSTDLQAGTLGRQLSTLFQTRSGLGTTTEASVSQKACIHAVDGANRPVKLVISAHYRGSPATVVIVSDGNRYLGIVAGSHCSATNSDILATAVVSPGISTP